MPGCALPSTRHGLMSLRGSRDEAISIGARTVRLQIASAALAMTRSVLPTNYSLLCRFATGAECSSRRRLCPWPTGRILPPSARRVDRLIPPSCVLSKHGRAGPGDTTAAFEGRFHASRWPRPCAPRRLPASGPLMRQMPAPLRFPTTTPARRVQAIGRRLPR